MKGYRKIIHIDMDAFYAAVEQRDRPELRGKPVIVGGDPRKRGVVAACSYEARRFGIHSAMPGKIALARCPHAVFLRPRMAVYRRVSAEIREIFHEYTDQVEPLSLDEAFLDVTVNKKGNPSATCIAECIRRDIRTRTGLTASAGISFNKFLAKVASDENKPDGITVVPPHAADSFIGRLPIRKFHGVGKVTEEKMLAMGIRTGADLRRISRVELARRFGKAGNYFYDIAHGQDHRPVNADRMRKSISREITFSEDIEGRDRLTAVLRELADRLEILVRKHAVRGMTLTIKVRFSDFLCITRSVTLDRPIISAETMTIQAGLLLDAADVGEKRVRLLGMGISNFEIRDPSGIHRQLHLPFSAAYCDTPAGCGRPPVA
ncbi:DNA polymerase IV [Desulfococcus multivorans]|jgi:DNA polymerase-4|uniref:DNA polymerase IV n=1 Tax=Desulfococcus multivorans DSM 2059 TaxID=1121405 RepID=S7U0F8_DESML|nr:DNA polymerase IV [Desulfococcus multivorans]AOY57022.1 DinB1: DNA-directed DNA polymerase IV [Desulfococcus multivorans]AQU99538.1 DNA polymerase IV [Desulfococcus multivorans]EPR42911.1 DNA polymerase IV [Desulfococcus multivorans DSM 2059]MDX9818031.1 DNA polymerase IV [Desulfococcus multivorans]SJZ89385.1 DNA polymerase-4 [Desulfococcus multivorans DSM 2059]